MHTEEVKIDAVVFDLGKVLIDYDFNRAIQGAARLANLPPADVRQRLLGEGHFFDFECGHLSGPEFHGKVQTMLDCAIPYDTFCELWNCIFIGEIEPTVALFLALQQRSDLKVGILSNTNALHFEHVRQNMSGLVRLREMKHVYASHQIRCRKPGAPCYQLVLKNMEVRAERCVFIDDMAENIASAEALGMHGIHATSPEAVRLGLQKLGLAGMAIGC